MTHDAAPSLIRESPALYGALIRILNREELELIECAYREVADFGGREDSRIHREEGVSFNPRAARVCQILLGECGERSCSVFTTAVLSCREFGDPEKEVGQERSLLQERIWSQRLKDWRSGEDFQPLFLERIYLAKLLDDARHCHMVARDDERRAEVVRKVRSVVSRPVENGSERLRSMLLAWLERVERSE